MTLRKEDNYINNTPSTTRDPTFAREYFNNYAWMPYIQLRTSNTLAAPTAAERILRGVSPTESSNYLPIRVRPTSIPTPMPRFNQQCGNGYGHGHDYGSNEAMWEEKGCRMNTSPSGTNRMTSSDLECNQDRDPLAEESELGPHAIEEVDGLFNEFCERPETNERPTRPERPNTSPPRNPEGHRSPNTPTAA